MEMATRRWSDAAAKNPDAPLEAVTASYLSPEHLGEKGEGCAMVALGADAARQGAEVAPFEHRFLKPDFRTAKLIQRDLASCPAHQRKIHQPRWIKPGDVATRAGVSRWTVARAFEKDGSISEKSRTKVMQAVDELGYVPDLLAASLASDRSNLVALLVDDFDNPHKLVMPEHLTRILRAAGSGTLLVNMPGEDDAPDALLLASQRRVDTAVRIGTQFTDTIRQTALGARRVKKRIVFARASASPDTISIGCDYVAAMGEITRHIFAQGYQRPMFLAGPDTDSTRLMRKEAFLRRWAEAKGSPVPDVVHLPRYALTDGYSGLLAYLKAHPIGSLPDVVICKSDVLALGAIDALRHGMGLNVPQDIAVTGFDAIPIAASLAPMT